MKPSTFRRFDFLTSKFWRQWYRPSRVRLRTSVYTLLDGFFYGEYHILFNKSLQIETSFAKWATFHLALAHFAHFNLRCIFCRFLHILSIIFNFPKISSFLPFPTCWKYWSLSIISNISYLKDHQCSRYMENLKGFAWKGNSAFLVNKRLLSKNIWPLSPSLQIPSTSS